MCICALQALGRNCVTGYGPYQFVERIVRSEADVLFSNGSPGDNLIFVRNGKYRRFFENNSNRRQIHVNFFL